jgi:hypothetical protein
MALFSCSIVDIVLTHALTYVVLSSVTVKFSDVCDAAVMDVLSAACSSAR